MSDEIEILEVDIDENEPVFFKVKALTLVASAARIISWVVLAGFVAIIAGNLYNLNELSQGAKLAELLKAASPRLWMVTNLVTPFLIGATCFITLQGVCNIIDALLEVDFNTREAK